MHIYIDHDLIKTTLINLLNLVYIYSLVKFSLLEYFNY